MLGIFLDTETNGLHAGIHKILEVAFAAVDLSTGEERGRFHTLISPSIDAWQRSDQESLRVNGFTWEEVSKGQTPRQASQEIIDRFAELDIRRKKAVFVCQNPSFDRVFFSQLIDPETQELLRWPYHWLDLASMHWALTMLRARTASGPLPWEVGLSKDMIAAFHNLPLEARPHRAMNGVNHLLLCYQAVVGFPAPAPAPPLSKIV
jgi:DNA polymerase-3 subunit epsilon/oligoribonuclease